MHDKAIKTLQDLCRKTAAKAAKTQTPKVNIQKQVEATKAEIESNLKKRKIMQNMSEMLLKKNRDLYLKHELMLDDEKQKRVELGASF